MPEEKILNRYAGNHEKEVSYMLEAYRMVPKDVSLAKAVLRCLYENGRFTELKETYEGMNPDLRECETITLDLWYRIEEKKAEAAGESFDKESAVPPQFVDFRMFANIEWLKGE